MERRGGSWLLLLLLAAVLGSHSDPLHLQYDSDPPVWSHRYLGEWSSRLDNMFGLYANKLGRCYFACYSTSKASEPTECHTLMFDGLWEDNDLYDLHLKNVTYDAVANTIQTSSPADLLSDPDVVVRSFRVYGDLRFSPAHTFPVQASGLLRCDQAGVRISLTLAELSVEQVKSPKVTYSFIVTVLSVAQLFAFTTLAKDCVMAERVALTVSKVSLLMNCVIDCCLWLWHMGMAFAFSYCFDYLVITALWSLFVYLLVQRRLVPIVWSVQNRERMQFVCVT
jgi:hypothetical protein